MGTKAPNPRPDPRSSETPDKMSVADWIVLSLLALAVLALLASV